MTIKLRLPWGGHEAGAVVRESFENERGLVAGGAADFVEAAAVLVGERGPEVVMPLERGAGGRLGAPVTKPAEVAASNERVRKQALAQKIREAGGDVPHHNSGVDKFEAALAAALAKS